MLLVDSSVRVSRVLGRMSNQCNRSMCILSPRAAHSSRSRACMVQLESVQELTPWDKLSTRCSRATRTSNSTATCVFRNTVCTELQESEAVLKRTQSNQRKYSSHISFPRAAHWSCTSSDRRRQVAEVCSLEVLAYSL